MADLERRIKKSAEIAGAVGGWYFASGEESFPPFASSE